MHAHPQPAVRPILEQIDVMVAAADGAELRSCEIEQRALLRHRTLRDRIEHRRIANRLVVFLADAERNRAPDLVHDVLQIEIRSLHVGTDRAIPAGDVVANPPA